MKKTKRLLALLLVLASLLTLTACGGAEAEEPAAEVPATQAAPMELQSVVVEEAAAAAKYADHVNIGLASQITTLDPGSVSNQQHFYLFNVVYNTLLSYDSINKTITNELAEVCEWADDTYSKIHVVLKEGVKFHNGTPLTSEDVAFSLDRTTSTLCSNTYDHCEIIDDRTFDIVLNQANVDFMYVLTHNCTAIVCKSAAEADPEYGTAIGTGAWVIDMDNYVAGDTIALVRNEEYWGELPETKTMTMRLITNSSARLIALQNGEIDIMTGIAATETDAAKADESIEVYEFGTAQMYYFAFNNANGPAAGNETLRKAVTYAINREELRMATGDMAGTDALSFWGWHMKYHTDEFDTDMTYNPEKAKELVAELGGEPTLHLMVNTTNNSYKVMAQVIQEQCRQVGITIIIDEVDSAGATANSKFASAKHEAMIYSINMNDWDSDMARLLSVGSNTNKAVLTDERITGLLSKAVATNDEAEAQGYYGEIQKIIHDECFYIPLYYTTDTVAYADGVSGMALNASRNHDYSYIKKAVE